MRPYLKQKRQRITEERSHHSPLPCPTIHKHKENSQDHNLIFSIYYFYMYFKPDQCSIWKDFFAIYPLLPLVVLHLPHQRHLLYVQLSLWSVHFTNTLYDKMVSPQHIRSTENPSGMDYNHMKKRSYGLRKLWKSNDLSFVRRGTEPQQLSRKAGLVNTGEPKAV